LPPVVYVGCVSDLSITCPNHDPHWPSTRRALGQAWQPLDAAMTNDWDYAALVEINGKRILFDTGDDPGILAMIHPRGRHERSLG
jgi:metal-dependent hydrolase (beta-lactamase superfamily II)